jgi:hypothetical protein
MKKTEWIRFYVGTGNIFKKTGIKEAAAKKTFSPIYATGINGTGLRGQNQCRMYGNFRKKYACNKNVMRQNRLSEKPNKRVMRLKKT